MHVEEVDGVGGLMTIEYALLDHDHAIAISASIDDAGAHTAAGALTAGDEGIDTEVVQMPCQRRTPESAGRGFTQDGFTGQGCDLINNIVSALPPVTGFGTHRSRLCCSPADRPTRHAILVQTRHMHNGDASLSGDF